MVGSFICKFRVAARCSQSPFRVIFCLLHTEREALQGFRRVTGSRDQESARIKGQDGGQRVVRIRR